MAVLGTSEWVTKFQQALNDSPAYAEAAKNWEGDFYFVIQADENFPKEVTMYLDLWHGKCREAYIVTNASEKTPEYTVSAKPKVWRQLIERKLDPMQALVTRRISLNGNMAKVMKSIKAAQELVNSTTKVQTEFPF